MKKTHFVTFCLISFTVHATQLSTVHLDTASSRPQAGTSITFQPRLGDDNNAHTSIWRTTASQPKATITVNGENKSVQLNNNAPLSFSLSLVDDSLTESPADWWLIHIGPENTAEYFELKTMAFKPGISTSLQEILFSFNNFALPPLTFTTPGQHTVYFGIDLNQNGNIDFATAFYDSVEIGINDEHANQTSAKTVYNQAYQDNFEVDNISDILKLAKNAYVLIDPFDSSIAERIAEIQQNNNEVGCYISIGTGEDWRDDFAQIQPYLVNKQWGDWLGEYFVNQTNTGILAIMQARIDKMAQWHCDWVEFDNMNWAEDDQYRRQYAFQVSQPEARAYYQALCDYVHQQGMKCMAKNTVEKAADFDGALYESFHNEKNWWDTDGTQSFLNVQKLVIINHYNETDCDKTYQDYQQFYNDSISFICEDVKAKGYVHY